MSVITLWGRPHGLLIPQFWLVFPCLSCQKNGSYHHILDPSLVTAYPIDNQTRTKTFRNCSKLQRPSCFYIPTISPLKITKFSRPGTVQTLVRREVESDTLSISEAHTLLEEVDYYTQTVLWAQAELQRMTLGFCEGRDIRMPVGHRHRQPCSSPTCGNYTLWLPVS